MVDVLVKYVGLGSKGASELFNDEVGLPWGEYSGCWLVVGLVEAFKEFWSVLYPLFEADACGCRGDVWEEQYCQLLEAV